MNRVELLERAESLKTAIDMTLSLILFTGSHVDHYYFQKKVETYKKELVKIKELLGEDYMSKVYDYYLKTLEFEGPGYTEEEALEDIYQSKEEKLIRITKENQELKEENWRLKEKLMQLETK